jgi:regulatory protein
MNEALRLLGRRPLTEAELKSRLAERGHDPASIEDAMQRLRAAGYVDDRKLAAHYLVVRTERGAMGPRRLLADLDRRGVPRALSGEVWLDLIREGVLDPAAAARVAAERRLRDHRSPLDRRQHARVYNALLRAGFEPEAIRVALEPYLAGLDGSEGDLSETSDDDFT